MNIQISEIQKDSIEKGAMTTVLVSRNDYQIGGKVHLHTGMFQDYEKVAVKECKKVSTVLVEPKSSENATIIEVDYLMLSTQEKQAFAKDCGYEDLATFLKLHKDKKEYSLIHFK